MQASPDENDQQRLGRARAHASFSLDQDRLQSIGLTSSDVAQQLQFLLSGIPITDVREDIRSVQVTARSAGARGSIRQDRRFHFGGHGGPTDSAVADRNGGDPHGRPDPASPRSHADDHRARRHCRGLAAAGRVHRRVEGAPAHHRPAAGGLPIEQGGSIESGKANRALAPLFPIMIALTLITIIVQVRSISVMTMVFATAPLGLIGVIPTLLLFQQPFGINALVGLIALSGILMRNTLILIGQIRQNEKDGLAPFDAVVEATVQRSVRSF